MDFVYAIKDFLIWLISLAKPENLKQIVNLGGPWWVGYLILAAIIFSETGLLIGFFLPGDSLLFAAGVLSSPAGDHIFNFWGLNALLIAAAIIGDAVNYYLGTQAGTHVFDKGRFRFIKQDHLLAAKNFYERHGGKAIILARFIPLVRTFTPFVAGVAHMSYAKFALFNIVGGVAWVLSMTTAGYFLGQIKLVADHFEKVVVGIVFISLLPVIIEVFKHWRHGKKTVDANGSSYDKV